MKRIGRDELYIETVKLVAKRSTCERKQVGAILIRDLHIIAMGYNGAATGEPHCTEVGCVIDENGGCTHAVHAEANIIAFCAKHGISTEGTALIVTVAPCYNCAKLLLNAGIDTVIFLEKYRNTQGLDLLDRHGVILAEVHENDTRVQTDEIPQRRSKN